MSPPGFGVYAFNSNPAGKAAFFDGASTTKGTHAVTDGTDTVSITGNKVYAFDTGFVCAFRGWRELRPEDVGLLWEHFVLNELHAHLQPRTIGYWRSKHGNEIDFVIDRPGASPIAIECKRSSAEFDARSIRFFRARYPNGPNFVVSPDVDRAYEQRAGEVPVRFVGLADLIREIVL